MVALMTPFSRGTIRLAGPTPGASPIINPRYYSDDRDIDRMVHGLRVAREIGSAPALAHWRGRETLPGPDVHEEDGLRAYLFRNLRSYSHYAGDMPDRCRWDGSGRPRPARTRCEQTARRGRLGDALGHLRQYQRHCLCNRRTSSRTRAHPPIRDPRFAVIPRPRAHIRHGSLRVRSSGRIGR